MVLALPPPWSYVQTVAGGFESWRRRVLQAIPRFPGIEQDESLWTPGYTRLASCGYSLLEVLPHLEIVCTFADDDRPDPRRILPELFDELTSGVELSSEHRRPLALWATGHFLNAAQSSIAAALDAIVNNLLLRGLPEGACSIVDELLHLYPSTRLHILLATAIVTDPFTSPLKSLREAFDPSAADYHAVGRLLKECNFVPLTLETADAWDAQNRPGPLARPEEPHRDWQAVVLCWSRCNTWKHLPKSSHEARLRRLQVHFTDWIWAYRGLCALSAFWTSDASAT
jgi:hypothetical protein